MPFPNRLHARVIHAVSDWRKNSLPGVSNHESRLENWNGRQKQYYRHQYYDWAMLCNVFSYFTHEVMRSTRMNPIIRNPSLTAFEISPVILEVPMRVPYRTGISTTESLCSSTRIMYSGENQLSFTVNESLIFSYARR